MPDFNDCSHLMLEPYKHRFLLDAGHYLRGEEDFTARIVIPTPLHDGMGIYGQTANGCVIYQFPAIQKLLALVTLSFPDSVFGLIFYKDDSDSSDYYTSDDSTSEDSISFYLENPEDKTTQAHHPTRTASAPAVDLSVPAEPDTQQAHSSPPAASFLFENAPVNPVFSVLRSSYELAEPGTFPMAAALPSRLTVNDTDKQPLTDSIPSLLYSDDDDNNWSSTRATRSPSPLSLPALRPLQRHETELAPLPTRILTVKKPFTQVNGEVYPHTVASPPIDEDLAFDDLRLHFLNGLHAAEGPYDSILNITNRILDRLESCSQTCPQAYIMPQSQAEWEEITYPHLFKHVFLFTLTVEQLMEKIEDRGNGRRLPNRWEPEIIPLVSTRHLIFDLVESLNCFFIYLGYPHGLRQYAPNLIHSHEGLGYPYCPLLNEHEAIYLDIAMDIFYIFGERSIADQLYDILHTRLRAPHDVNLLLLHVLNAIAPPNFDYGLLFQLYPFRLNEEMDV